MDKGHSTIIKWWIHKAFLTILNFYGQNKTKARFKIHKAKVNSMSIQAVPIPPLNICPSNTAGVRVTHPARARPAQESYTTLEARSGALGRGTVRSWVPREVSAGLQGHMLPWPQEVLSSWEGSSQRRPKTKSFIGIYFIFIFRLLIYAVYTFPTVQYYHYRIIYEYWTELLG